MSSSNPPRPAPRDNVPVGNVERRGPYSTDVSEAFRRNKVEDPRRQGDASLLAALHQHFGATPFKGAEVIAVREGVAGAHGTPTLAERALHDALDDVLGSRGVNAKLFGYWGRRVRNAQ